MELVRPRGSDPPCREAGFLSVPRWPERSAPTSWPCLTSKAPALPTGRNYAIASRRPCAG